MHSSPMIAWTSLGGFACAALAALLFYRASPHAPYARAARPRPMRTAALALALLSLGAWIGACGLGAGLCATLASLMFTLLALPCLALRGRAPERD